MNLLKREITILWGSHRKWGVALLAFAGTVVNQGLLHGAALRWTQIGLAFLGALGVRAIANTDYSQGQSDGGEADIALLLLVATFVGVVLLLFGVHFGSK